MKLRYGFAQAGGGGPNMTVAIIDADGYALLMEYPRTLHYSDGGRSALAFHIWMLRKEIRQSRSTRIRPTGGLNS
jgi:hypothetical protein